MVRMELTLYNLSLHSCFVFVSLYISMLFFPLLKPIKFLSLFEKKRDAVEDNPVTFQCDFSWECGVSIIIPFDKMR